VLSVDVTIPSAEGSWYESGNSSGLPGLIFPGITIHRSGAGRRRGRLRRRGLFFGILLFPSRLFGGGCGLRWTRTHRLRLRFRLFFCVNVFFFGFVFLVVFFFVIFLDGGTLDSTGQGRSRANSGFPRGLADSQGFQNPLGQLG
jgi:hypothetical protein